MQIKNEQMTINQPHVELPRRPLNKIRLQQFINDQSHFTLTPLRQSHTSHSTWRQFLPEKPLSSHQFYQKGSDIVTK